MEKWSKEEVRANIKSEHKYRRVWDINDVWHYVNNIAHSKILLMRLMNM